MMGASIMHPLIHKADELLDRAREDADAEAVRQHLQDAERLYRVVLEEMPGLPDALSGLGHVLWDRSDSVEDPEARLALIEEAIQTLTQAAEKHSFETTSILSIAEVLLHTASIEPDEGRSVGLVHEATRWLTRADHFTDDVAVLRNQARAFEMLSERAEDAKESAEYVMMAEERFAAAIRRRPRDPHLLHLWGCVLLDRAAREEDQDRIDGLRIEATEKFAEAVRIEPDFEPTWTWWGRALFERAEEEPDPARADRLLRDAGEHCARALRSGGDAYGTNKNLALIHGRRAGLTENDELSHNHVRLAEGYYASALAARPHEPDVHRAWGETLFDHGVHASNPEHARASLERAIDHYATVGRLEPDDADAPFWEGEATAELAHIRSDAALSLLERAMTLYDRSNDLRPGDPDTLNRWGQAYLSRAHLCPEVQEDMLVSAVEFFVNALELDPDHGQTHYNLGCVAAMREDVETALVHLACWRAVEVWETRDRVDEDPKFDRIRDDSRLQALLAAGPTAITEPTD
ncbi:MAG: hypothetical protein CMJ83_04375 [Planctomycetes bacterium]|nr:hypothetical protein [Planctomycetota bacterium]